jgi:hypothetical protein
MLLPAVPASVSATDSHISPTPIRSPALCGVHLPAGIWGHPSFLLNFFFGGSHEGGGGESWQPALFWAALRWLQWRSSMENRACGDQPNPQRFPDQPNSTGAPSVASVLILS